MGLVEGVLEAWFPLHPRKPIAAREQKIPLPYPAPLGHPVSRFYREQLWWGGRGSGTPSHLRGPETVFILPKVGIWPDNAYNLGCGHKLELKRQP